MSIRENAVPPGWIPRTHKDAGLPVINIAYCRVTQNFMHFRAIGH